MKKIATVEINLVYGGSMCRCYGAGNSKSADKKDREGCRLLCCPANLVGKSVTWLGSRGFTYEDEKWNCLKKRIG